ncbi:MAG: hypothetical protein KDA24_05790 [Deltaproteobacteria bacterium]|nr:hypothetical protein [Deltaproteobacteria bacterium]
MKRPYLAPKDSGGPGHVVDLELGRKADAPWDSQASGRPRGRPIPGAPPTPSRAEPAPQAAPPPRASSGLAIDAGASASEYTRQDSESYWSLPAIPAVPPGKVQPPSDSSSLSGAAEEFDVATGWNFPAVDLPADLAPKLDMTAAEREAPILPSTEEIFSSSGTWGSIPEEPPAPARAIGLEIPSAPRRPAPPAPPPSAPPPRAAHPAPASHGAVDVEQLLAKGRELLSAGELGTALKLLRHARRLDRANNSVATWLEFAERRLMREHLPDAKPESVPLLAQDRRHLMGQASGLEKQLVAAIDGKRTIAALLGAANSEAYVPMLKMLGAFVGRGWIKLG